MGIHLGDDDFLDVTTDWRLGWDPIVGHFEERTRESFHDDDDLGGICTLIPSV